MGYIKYSNATSSYITSDGSIQHYQDLSLITIYAQNDIDIYINNSLTPVHLTVGGIKIIKDMTINTIQVLPIGAKYILYKNCELYVPTSSDTVDMIARNQITDIVSKIGNETFTESNVVLNSNSILKNIDNLDSRMDDLNVIMANFGMSKVVELYQEFTGDGITKDFQITTNNNGILQDTNGNLVPLNNAYINIVYNADVSSVDKKAVYTNGSVFTRSRVYVSSINNLGQVSLTEPPANGSVFRIYFAYNLPSNVLLGGNYYNYDYLAGVELGIGQLVAKNIQVDNTNTGYVSTELQSVIEEIDHISDAHILSDIHLSSSERDALTNSSTPSATNPIATMADLSGIGGTVYPLVADNTELSNIPSADRVDKMLIPVDINGYFYKYDATSIQVADGVKIVEPFDSVGRYIQFMKSTTLHNMLSGIQGGINDEYYHFTAQDYNERVTTTNAVTLKNKAIAVHTVDGNTITGLQQSDIANLTTDLSNKVDTTTLTNYARLDAANTFTGANNFTGGLTKNNIDVVDVSSTQRLYNKTIDVADNNIIKVNIADVNGLSTNLTNIDTNITNINTNLNAFTGKFDLSSGTVGQILTIDNDGIIKPKTSLSANGGFNYTVDNELQLTILTPIAGETVLVKNYNSTGKPNMATYDGTTWNFNANDVHTMSKTVYDTDNDGKVDMAEVADSANSVDWEDVQNPPLTYPPSSHDHDALYYQKTEWPNKFQLDKIGENINGDLTYDGALVGGSGTGGSGSSIKVGATTMTGTVELVAGNNITLTPNALANTVTITSTASGGSGGGFAVSQVEALGVVATSMSPHAVILPITTTDFNVAPVTVLKYIPGITNAIVPIASFAESEKSNTTVSADDDVVFNGTMKLKTTVTTPMDEMAFGTGKLLTTTINMYGKKKIEKIEII